MQVFVVGGGIFGVTAALVLRARRCDVTLIDPGTNLGASIDTSEVIRIDTAPTRTTPSSASARSRCGADPRARRLRA